MQHGNQHQTNALSYYEGVVLYCHAHDNQSHPRPKASPSCLVPLSSHPLQVAEITLMSSLHNPYVIQHYLASPQPNLEHHRPCLNVYSHTQATSLSILLAQAHICHTRLLEILAKSFVIVASLYLVFFYLCTSLFLPRLYHCPVPTLYLSLYLLHLVV